MGASVTLGCRLAVSNVSSLESGWVSAICYISTNCQKSTSLQAIAALFVVGYPSLCFEPWSTSNYSHSARFSHVRHFGGHTQVHNGSALDGADQTLWGSTRCCGAYKPNKRLSTAYACQTSAQSLPVIYVQVRNLATDLDSQYPFIFHFHLSKAGLYLLWLNLRLSLWSLGLPFLFSWSWVRQHLHVACVLHSIYSTYRPWHCNINAFWNGYLVKEPADLIMVNNFDIRLFNRSSSIEDIPVCWGMSLILNGYIMNILKWAITVRPKVNSIRWIRVFVNWLVMNDSIPHHSARSLPF